MNDKLDLDVAQRVCDALAASGVCTCGSGIGCVFHDARAVAFEAAGVMLPQAIAELKLLRACASRANAAIATLERQRDEARALVASAEKSCRTAARALDAMRFERDEARAENIRLDKLLDRAAVETAVV